jgi:hypothetical protein
LLEKDAGHEGEAQPVVSRGGEQHELRVAMDGGTGVRAKGKTKRRVAHCYVITVLMPVAVGDAGGDGGKMKHSPKMADKERQNTV